MSEDNKPGADPLVPVEPNRDAAEGPDAWVEQIFGRNGLIRKNLTALAVFGCVASGLMAVRIGFQMGIKRSAMTQARLLGNPGAMEQIQDSMFAGSQEQVASRTAIATRALKYGTILCFTGFGAMTAGTAYMLGINSLADIRPVGERIMLNPRLAMQNSRLARWVRGKREEMFPSLNEDPTGLRSLLEAIQELDPEEQKDVANWWNWLNTPTSWQLAEMAESAELESLDEEMAQLQRRQQLDQQQLAEVSLVDAQSKL